jgi:dihydropteroate synthase
MGDGPVSAPRFPPAARPHLEWKLRDRTLRLGARTLVMGVLNITPDSFSDGGLFQSHENALAHGLRLLDEGADILDIGGESTRPGATSVSDSDELARVLPTLTALRRARPAALLSIDTTKAIVARAAINAGADIVNDVSGFLWDDAMPSACADLGCGVIVMHTRGRPDLWRLLPDLRRKAVLPLVREGLAISLDLGLAAGVRREAMVVDPGFGFGKRGDENYWLLADLAGLATLGRPLAVGLSRKSFLGRTLEQIPPPASASSDPAPTRAIASVTAATAAILSGAHIIRAHDVRPTIEAAAIADAILNAAT